MSTYRYDDHFQDDKKRKKYGTERSIDGEKVPASFPAEHLALRAEGNPSAKENVGMSTPSLSTSTAQTPEKKVIHSLRGTCLPVQALADSGVATLGEGRHDPRLRLRFVRH